MGKKKYKIDTSRIQDVKRITVKGINLKNAEMYQGASYYLLEKVFEWLQDRKLNGPLIDFGCGKGRVLIVGAAYDFHKITGIDFAKSLCEEAEANIRRVQQNFPATNFTIVHEDVVDYQIDELTNCFFFFNPFNEFVMKKVLKNIAISLNKSPRTCYVIYINPQHKEVFTSAGFTEAYHIRKYRYIEASILTLII
ncbi:MAG: class I SAM-dependent methyltransferase [Chitinophagaceae bacterium]